MGTILVVDDMAVFREPIAASLRQKGYQTACAKNGREALDVAKRDRPDLILLDMAMPEMDGLTFLKKMQADHELRGVPVIMLTAVGERESVVEACKLGASEYLLKSQFSLDEMTSRIESCLSEADQHGAEGEGHTGDDAEPGSDFNDAEEDIDLEAPGALGASDSDPSPVEGLEDVAQDMDASMIIQQIQASEELSALTSDPESVQSADAR